MKSNLFNVLGSKTTQGEEGDWGDFGTAPAVVDEVKKLLAWLYRNEKTRSTMIELVRYEESGVDFMCGGRIL